MNINDVPSDIILEIFTYLPQPVLVTTVGLVCHRWNELASAPALWHQLNLYHSSIFLSASKHKLNAMLQKIGHHVKSLKTRVPCVYTKFRPELFTDLKSLHIRMYDNDDIEKFGDIIDCFKDLETFKLDVSTFERLTSIISVCKRLTNLRKFHLRHFFCNHSANLKLMPHVFQVLFQNTTLLTHVTLSCGDIYLDSAIQTLSEKNPNLVELNLNRCSGLTSTAFTSLHFSKLRSLVLDRTSVDDQALKLVAENSPYLETLSISKCRNVTDKGLYYIGMKCIRLRKITINMYSSGLDQCCQVTNSGLLSVAEGCSNLRQIIGNYHPYINVDILSNISQLCSNIQVLEFEKISKVTDTALIAIATQCTLLQCVNFSECEGVSGSGVSRFLLDCKWLMQAKFNSCMDVANISLGSTICQEYDDTQRSEQCENSMTKSHSYIQVLHFRYCKYLTAKSLIEISQFCPDLNELRIAGWTAACDTDDALVRLFTNCTNLQLLLCSGIQDTEETNFTSRTVEAIANYGHNIKQLHFSLNYFITIDDLQKVLSLCNNLEQITLYVNENTALYFGDIEILIANCDTKKIGLNSYKRLMTTCCQISIKN